MISAGIIAPTTNSLAEAIRLVRLGFRPIPVPRGSKAPILKDWQNLRLTEEDLPRYFEADVNLGLLLGEPSDGLVDIDMDCIEAVRAAMQLLPPTSMRHGRPSNPSSHRWYLSDESEVISTRRYVDLAGHTLVELRSTGAQTIVPPSTHPSGETLAWEEDGEPARVQATELILGVAKVAAAALLAKAWPQGSRHDAALALAGWLLRVGWAIEEVETFVRAVALAAADDEVPDRVRVVRDTSVALREGQAVTGRTRLMELLPDGERIVSRVSAWLALPSTPVVEGVGGESAKEAADVVKPPFHLTDAGVFFEEECDEDGIDLRWAPVCSHLEVRALTRDASGEEWGRLLAVTDDDGTVHEWAMPMGLMAGDGAGYRERLLSLGLRIEPGPKARQRLHSYITTTKPSARARCVSRVGWHSAKAKVFVLPDCTFGSDDERVLLQAAVSVDHALRTSGTIGEWQDNVAALCAGNSRLVFALSVAFAAPLLHLVNEEGGGFHLRGPSSIGKSTALRVAASAWGGGVSGFVRTWRATANGLEGLAESHCDMLLCLDEMGQVNGREAGEVAYMLANGSGKARASRDGLTRRSARWRTLFLSTGEISLADKMMEAGQRPRAGQETRLADILGDAGAGLGLFEDLHGFRSADAFARHLCDASGRFYGTPAREYLRRLTEDLDGLHEALIEGRRRWASRYCTVGADGQVQRVAARFGLVAAAGELASTMGILPWEDGEASLAAKGCFDAWVEARGGVGAAEVVSGLMQVRRFISLHGESRFTPVGKSEADRPTINRAGFRITNKAGETEYWVLPEIWKTEVCAGLDTTTVNRALVDAGALIPDSLDKKPQSRQRLPGIGTRRVYHLGAAVLGQEASDA